MRFVADIYAINPLTKEMRLYVDVIDIPCEDIDDANVWCQTNGKGYMFITGVFQGEYKVSELEIDKIKEKL